VGSIVGSECCSVTKTRTHPPSSNLLREWRPRASRRKPHSGSSANSTSAIGCWLSDPLDYSTVAHHSSMDVYDRTIAGDLMQCSAVIASVAYDATTRKEMLPRKQFAEG
jgi:hypothetical protein